MELEFSKLGPRVITVLAALSVISIACGVIGWSIEPHPKLEPARAAAGAGEVSAPHAAPLLDAAYRALKSVEMGEPYDDIGEKGLSNIWLEASRFIGVAVSFAAVFLFVWAALGKQMITHQARSRRKHVIIAGTSAFADRLGESLEGHVVHLCSSALEPRMEGRRIRLPYAHWRADMLEDAGSKQARKLLIAPDTDDAAIDLALQAQKHHPTLTTYVRLKDYGLAQRIHRLPGAERLRAFADSGVAAREIVRRHPPFLLAQDLGHKHFHALLIGEPDWIEALMAEILASACTLTYGRPAFTIVCDAPGDFEARLVQRYPELRAAADLRFRLAGPMTHLPASEGGIEHPAITAVYIVLGEDADVLSAALTFADHAARDQHFAAPIFVLSRNPNGIEEPPPGAVLAPLQLVPFGSPKAINRALGLLADEADRAERDYHQAYLRFAPDGGEASKPWDELKEEYRISNARSVAHIHAKLFEAGFDLRGWMRDNPDIWTALPALETDQRLWRDAAELTRLAELEHERWIVDRRLNGWSYGPKRDNVRKLHPDIKPFDQLSPEIQRYDYAFIEQLAEILGTRAGGLRRL